MKLSTIFITGLSLIMASCSPASQNSSQPLISDSQTHGTQMTKTNAAAIHTVKSSYTFSETVTRLEAGLDKRPLNLFAKIDHAAGAAKAGQTLAPSTVFIFGNPKGGTPLMTRNPQMGIVLPLKMHVYQDGDAVKLSYTDIEAEAKLHGLDSAELPIPNIKKMLGGLAAEVTTAP